MNYIKARKDLLFIANPLIFIFGLFLFCYLPNAIVPLFRLFWLCTIAAVFFIFSPYGNHRFADAQDETAARLPFSQWILCIIVLELSLFGAYYGIDLINNHLFLINESSTLSSFSTSLHNALLHYCLFPWSLYVMVAVSMGVLAYKQNLNAYFSALLEPLSKQNPQETLSLVVNTGARRCTMFAIGIALVFMTLLLINLALPLQQHIAHGYIPNALLSTLALLVFSYSDFAKRNAYRIFSRHISTAIGFPIFCIVFGIIIVFLSLATAGLTQQHPTTQEPHLIEQWIHFNSQTAWSIFSMTWWLCLTPLVSGFIARVSKGYRVREVIIGFLALPAITALCLAHPHMMQWVPWPTSTLRDNIIGLVSFIVLLPLLVNHSNSGNVILAYFPKGGVAKYRDHLPFFFRTLQVSVICVYLYLIIGINALSLFLFAPNYLSILTFFTCFLGGVKNIVSK